MKQVLRRAAGLIGAGLGAAALLGLGYVGVTWSRYGKINHRRRGDRMLDRFMPEYEVREQHQTKIAAQADVTFTVARAFDFQRSGLVRAIFTGRELIMGSDRSSRQRAPNFLSMVLELGWRILAEEPGRELVLGAVTQPWKADVEFRGLTPEEFIEFHDPGYV